MPGFCRHFVVGISRYQQSVRLSMLWHSSKNPFSTGSLLFKVDTSPWGPENLLQANLKSAAARDTILWLNSYGISEEDVKRNVHVFMMPFGIIEQRLRFCAEGGLRTSILSITNFDQIATGTISDLKRNNFLDEETNVVNEIMSSANFKGTLPPKFNPEASYQYIHFYLRNHIVLQNFGITFPTGKRYLHCSLQNILDNINLLKTEKMPWSWIKDQIPVLCLANTANISKLFELGKVYSLPIPMSVLLQKAPEVAFIDSEDLKSIFFLFKKHKVCTHNLNRLKKTDHFLMSPELLASGLEKVSSIPLKPTANIVSQLYQKKCITSLNRRNDQHLDCLIARQRHPLLCRQQSSASEPWQHEMKAWTESDDTNLEYKPCQHRPLPKSFVEDNIKYRRPMKLTSFVASALSVPVDLVKVELACLPMGLTVAVEHVEETLKLLFEYGFEKEDVKNSMQLLLYPRHLVKTFLEEKVLKDPIYGSANYKSKHLQLCLFYILTKYDYNLYNS